MTAIYEEILNTVFDNGRVSNNSEEFEASLVNEIEFEANEQGLSKEEIKEAVSFALTHS
jgi:hypothetical protein